MLSTPLTCSVNMATLPGSAQKARWSTMWEMLAFDFGVRFRSIVKMVRKLLANGASIDDIARRRQVRTRLYEVRTAYVAAIEDAKTCEMWPALVRPRNAPPVIASAAPRDVRDESLQQTPPVVIEEKQQLDADQSGEDQKWNVGDDRGRENDGGLEQVQSQDTFAFGDPFRNSETFPAEFDYASRGHVTVPSDGAGGFPSGGAGPSSNNGSQPSGGSGGSIA